MKDPEGANAQIEAKLDIVIRLLALSAISHHHSLRDRAISLQRAGLSPKEIAKLLTLSIQLDLRQGPAGVAG